MPAVHTDPLVLDIIARTDKLERSIKSAQAKFTTETEQMKRVSAVMRRQMEADSGAIGDTFKKLSAGLGAYFSGAQVIKLTESFTRFQNSLRVAGVASADLGAVQDRLFTSAQKYGIEIATLGGLYGSLANASKELGVSQEQVFQLTDTVAASLKVSGQSATEAAGALQQLGQVFRGGKVQAEEYNSLLDGAFPLLKAAAAGSDRFGGSVGKLTAAVKDGKVTSAEFFNAILAGSESVIKRAELSTMSLTGAYTQLTNALTIYVGEAAQSSGAQAALAAGIAKIAENLDTLIPALAIVGAAMGVKYVLSAGAATLATIQADAALAGVTTRAGVAGAAFASLARSLAINAALLGVVAAIEAVGAEIATTDALIKQANTQFDEMTKRLSAAATGASSASDGARSVGDGAAGAEPKVRSFAGAVGDLADQLFRQAKAAKEARIQTLETKLSESRNAETELMKRTRGGRNASSNEFRRGDFLNNAGVIIRGVVGGGKSLLSGGRTDREASEAYGKQSVVTMDLANQLRREREKPLTEYAPPPRAPGGAAPASTKKGGGKSAGKSAEQRQEEQERIEQQIASAQIGYLQDLAQSTENAARKAALDQEVIEATRKANELDLKNNESLSTAQRDKLIEINNQVAQLRSEQVQEQEAERLRQQQLGLTNEALRDEDRLLQLQGQLADTAASRRAIELRRLDVAYRLEQAAIAEELVQAEISGDLNRIAAARKRMADMEERRSLETAGVNRANESPSQRYLREINKTGGQIDEDIEAISARGLESLNDGLTDAITGAKSLGEAFGNVADQIISDLLRIAIQQAVIKPLAKSLFGGGAGAIVGPLPGIAQPAGTVLGSFRPWGADA